MCWDQSPESSYSEIGFAILTKCQNSCLCELNPIYFFYESEIWLDFTLANGHCKRAKTPLERWVVFTFLSAILTWTQKASVSHLHGQDQSCPKTFFSVFGQLFDLYVFLT